MQEITLLSKPLVHLVPAGKVKALAKQKLDCGTFFSSLMLQIQQITRTIESCTLHKIPSKRSIYWVNNAYWPCRLESPGTTRWQLDSSQYAYACNISCHHATGLLYDSITWTIAKAWTKQFWLCGCVDCFKFIHQCYQCCTSIWGSVLRFYPGIKTIGSQRCVSSVPIKTENVRFFVL